VTDDVVNMAIVGAGAAGLTAAIVAAETLAKDGNSGRVLLLDGAKQIGTKILVSGGGRCNVTHEVITPNDFFGNRNIIRNILAAFSVERTIAWFTSLGVNLKREPTGKLFPVTDDARTILTALLTPCPGCRRHHLSGPSCDRGGDVTHRISGAAQSRRDAGIPSHACHRGSVVAEDR
jgi:predicted flavoprotein YhiN